MATFSYVYHKAGVTVSGTWKRSSFIECVKMIVCNYYISNDHHGNQSLY